MLWHGPKHYFSMISTSRFLPIQFRLVVDQVLKRNSYYAHSESLLIAMLKDDNVRLQKMALMRIIKARGEDIPLRQYQPPSVNLNALSYENMIDWTKELNVESPLTKSITAERIKEMLRNDTISFDFPSFPCHNQAVERMVKLVTESSKAVVGVL